MEKSNKGKSNKRSGRSQASSASQRLFELEVALISGMILERFAKRNPQVARTIQIRGDQTLEELHEAIFTAFDPSDAEIMMFALRIPDRPTTTSE